jgi:hypothetical protein
MKFVDVAVLAENVNAVVIETETAAVRGIVTGVGTAVENEKGTEAGNVAEIESATEAGNVVEIGNEDEVEIVVESENEDEVEIVVESENAIEAENIRNVRRVTIVAWREWLLPRTSQNMKTVLIQVAAPAIITVRMRKAILLR